MVTSADGKSTKWKNKLPTTWNSKEDRELFDTIKKQARLIIMGKSTYEAAKGDIALTPDTLRVVLTNNPKLFRDSYIPHQLEFKNDDPRALLKNLEERGFTEGFLMGGAHTNLQFFKLGLVSELWLTLEPKIFGKGNGLVGENEVNFSLNLLSTKKLNKDGTLLLKYTVRNIKT